ncbi:signal peptidase I [Streptomyces sp. LHD-70]|uniref:signal peptidase I n=1 Tax=Streptomyces sp. LHD-70 TaxID=3072140 RepID=UPI00280EC5F4|nr:signal peptidase I [Streptomyces sp. LHD-70]MDQ8701844.1 signal peptidase I [Streptomyces sp. LHD-70]
MDTEAAQNAERDRSSHPADTEREEEGSRSAAVSGRRWRRGGVLVALCLVFLLLVSTFVLQPFLIPSGSMEPTLSTGDRVLVNKLAYRFGNEPQRGDVVVFDGSGYFGDSDYIKRVVGVGGDRVAGRGGRGGEQGRIQVNGEPVDEPYLYPGDAPSTVPFDVVVPEGTLFVLGDHRSDSSDSRDHLGSPGGGMVPVESVIGRADWIGLPLDRSGSLGRPDVFAKVPEPGGAHG